MRVVRKRTCTIKLMREEEWKWMHWKVKIIKSSLKHINNRKINTSDKTKLTHVFKKIIGKNLFNWKVKTFIISKMSQHCEKGESFSNFGNETKNCIYLVTFGLQIARIKTWITSLEWKAQTESTSGRDCHDLSHKMYELTHRNVKKPISRELGWWQWFKPNYLTFSCLSMMSNLSQPEKYVHICGRWLRLSWLDNVPLHHQKKLMNRWDHWTLPQPSPHAATAFCYFFLTIYTWLRADESTNCLGLWFILNYTLAFYIPKYFNTTPQKVKLPILYLWGILKNPCVCETGTPPVMPNQETPISKLYDWKCWNQGA